MVTINVILGCHRRPEFLLRSESIELFTIFRSGMTFAFKHRSR